MKKAELVWAWLLDDALKRMTAGTQAELSRRLNLSLSSVNAAIRPLDRIGAVKIRPRNYSVQDPKKILLYWASLRNLQKDTRYQTRALQSPSEIEKNMPAGTVFTGYSGFKLRFKQTPADYGEVYAYVDDVDEVQKRFPKSIGPANLFVMGKDAFPHAHNTVSVPHLFVDLWNLPTWYAKDFLNATELKLDGILA